jgi:hypothetical protein
MRGEMEARRRSRAEWRRRWRSVRYDDQKRVRDALRRGDEVDDPALAPLAVEAVEHRPRGDDGVALARHRGAISVVQALVGVAALAIGIAGDDTLQVAFGIILSVPAAAEIGVRRIERSRLRRAAEANRALAGLPRYPDEQT